MIRKIWIVLFMMLMYGGCGALFLSFLFKWGKVAIVVSIAIIVLSLVISNFTLKCPHCKKLTLPVKEMLYGIKVGKCTCANCGEEVEIK